MNGTFGLRGSSIYMNFMKVNIKGINIVRKRLSAGEEVIYIYAWKGGPRIYCGAAIRMRGARQSG
jgi:hypothetical protein